jgi:hypothetical protein
MQVVDDKRVIVKVARKGSRWSATRITAAFVQRGFVILEELPPATNQNTRIKYRCRCGQEPCYLTVNNCALGKDNCHECAQAKKTSRKMELHGTYWSKETKDRQYKARQEGVKRKREQREQQREDRRREKHFKKFKALIINMQAVEDGPEKEAILNQLHQHLREQGCTFEIQNEEAASSVAFIPAPVRSEYPHLSVRQFEVKRLRWYNSSPVAKAKLALYHLTESYRSNLERRKEKRRQSLANYKQKVRDRRAALKLSLSVNEHCSAPECNVPYNLCDIHHLRPDELLEDGKRRKQKNFGEIGTIPQFEMELQRNTDANGTVLLRLICPKHHCELTGSRPTQYEPQLQARVDYVAKRKVDIGHCQYDKCTTPEDQCTNKNMAHLFHFDHIYSKQDQRAPPHMKKIASISSMIPRLTQYSLNDIETEIQKCQLVHVNCHNRRTKEQHAQGLIHLGQRSAMSEVK